MAPLFVTAEHVHFTLRTIRAAGPLVESPLVGLAALAHSLGAEGVADSPAAKASFLPRWLGDVVWTQFCLARGETLDRSAASTHSPASASRPDRSPRSDLPSLAEDFRSNSVDREAWGVLHYYYFSGNSERLEPLAASLHLGLSTTRRRLDRGYLLLADVLTTLERQALRQTERPQQASPHELDDPRQGNQSLSSEHLETYRRGRVAEWSQPRYRLDRRFVSLSLLVDQGEESAAGRWSARQDRFDDLGTLLAALPDPAIVVLGPPGSGKSTLLRHLELQVAQAALTSTSPANGDPDTDESGLVWFQPGTDGPPVTFFVQLNRYRPPAPGQPLPSPAAWLAERWAAAAPGLPPLPELLAGGRMLLLLDALNEMPVAGEQDFRERIGWWKDWLVGVAKEMPGNRVVFSCRTLDYSAPLSTTALRVPQVQIEPLGDEQVQEFLTLHGPTTGPEIWASLAGTPLLETLRAPYFLSLLVVHVAATGELATDRAGLFTSLVRQALKREVLRHNPLFVGPGAVPSAPSAAASGGGGGKSANDGNGWSGRLVNAAADVSENGSVKALHSSNGNVTPVYDATIARHEPLPASASPSMPGASLFTDRDLRRLTQWQWRDACELPDRGALVPKLVTLAYRMQEVNLGGESRQVSLGYDRALDLIDHPRAEDIVKAGVAIGVLDEDTAADEVLFRHQLIQEYFAARALARQPRPELVASTWRSAEITPGLREILDALPPREALPPLPTTGWEETTALAVGLADDPETFLRSLMPHNLVVAGNAANLPTVLPRLSEPFLDEIRWALVSRSRDREADLRARIDAGLALGWLGDPRFERHVGLYGEYLLPLMVEISGGEYPIGEDEPIFILETNRDSRLHMPRHVVSIRPFAIGQFAVTNAEYACFIAAGGYEDDRWWETESAQAWRNGEGTAEGVKDGVRLTIGLLRETPELVETWHDGGMVDDEVYERWKRRLTMNAAEFEAHLTELYPGGRETAPRYWRDKRFNNPDQPVVGVGWYEAMAYCAWLGAQTGQTYRLPSEVEWEAATRGLDGRVFAYGDVFDSLKGNTLESHVQQPSPVGVYVEGDAPEGVSDLTGNTYDWTASLSERVEGESEYVISYPYDASDGREDVTADGRQRRSVRGGSWDYDRNSARAAYRSGLEPLERNDAFGFRVVRASPNST